MAGATLAQDLVHALDPVLFARERLGFDPDDWQQQLLGSRSHGVICNCSRQVGKSTTTAAMALHQALFDPGLILLISPSMRQTRELFGKVSEFLKRLQPVQELVEDNRMSCTLANGSRIVSLPGDSGTVRGFSAPKLIVEDEAAWCGDDIFEAVRPMLAVSQGRHILLSSPNGPRGHFFKLWTEGGPAWDRFSVTIHDCPRIPSAWIEQEQARTPPHRWAAEYECSFSESVNSLFGFDLIQKCMSDEVPALFNLADLVAMGAAR